VGDTYNLSIGQGYLLVTPLELATATASIVNGGKLYEPRIVKRIVSADQDITIQPKIINQNFISQKDLNLVKQGMLEAVNSGTARLLKTLKVTSGGKTGTAEIGNNKTHAWFVSFAPADKPEIVLVVLVEEGGEGSTTAVPLARDILNFYFSEK